MGFLGILLDLDGTLVDSLADICFHVNAVREANGLPRLSDAALRPAIGRGVEHLVREGIPELPPAKAPELIAHFRKSYLENPHAGGRLYPGVRETLAYLRRERRIRLAIVTNKITSVARKSLEYYLPGFLFDDISGPDRVSAMKPDPRHLEEVMERIHVGCEDAWFVGDIEVDKQCAEASGTSFLAASYGFGGVAAAPDQRLWSFPEILRKVPLEGWVENLPPNRV